MKIPILLVDDKRANLLALEVVLDGGGYELVSAASGAEAIALFEQRDFALALLDLQMPGMDGFDTTAHLREQARRLGRRTPIILVTARELGPGELARAYVSGAVDVINKPLLDARVLSAKVAIFAELYEARASIKQTAERRDEEQRLAQEESRRFRLLVESVKDYAIFILDPNGYVATWNLGAARIKGYTAAEIIGRHFSIFYPTDDVASGKCEQELTIADEEGRFEEEGWRLRKDGSKFWASVTITALRDPSGALVGFAKVTRDLTERVRHEETLRNLAAEKATLLEKQRIQEFQERFIAILGHDLRNPLAAIDMGAGLLQQFVTAAGNEAALRIVQRMRGSSRRMSRMIEQILDLTRTRLAGGLAMSPAPMDLAATIAAIVDELRTAHPGRNILVRSPGPVIGVWDRDRLEQVFSNVVGNAVHHGSATAPVEVQLRDEGSQVLVSVHNQGRPISAPTLAELFSPFRRGERDSRTAETAGLGLGLYISQEIALAHHGKIEAFSSADAGTTFCVTLPRAASYPDAEAASTAAVENGSRV